MHILHLYFVDTLIDGRTNRPLLLIVYTCKYYCPLSIFNFLTSIMDCLDSSALVTCQRNLPYKILQLNKIAIHLSDCCVRLFEHHLNVNMFNKRYKHTDNRIQFL